MDGLDLIPFHLMRKVFQEHTALWKQSLPELTKPQYSVLSAVAEQPGIEQVRLTQAAISTKATLAELLARLEKRGLIERRQQSADKRRRFVYLTQEGKRVLSVATPLAQKVDQFFLSRLRESDQQRLTSLLHQMTYPAESKD
ncbi:MarR family winged helix-turn-helix transcriptional regulator [Vibrio quintilis]|uniref:Transcriptional regulator HosA n=1 Tax=Vibrio quintilis TaxID=1117707 RepID=A0A1M7Z091_9VIBR|nr:MarR family transcriptional regulator [Vibrio quintilis]SHO58232.1 Transcriptional regulator HosA [Vibrio quintilis]